MSDSGGITGADAQRHRPIKVEWDGATGWLHIDGECWGAVEWSDKRQAWCIEDAEGRCLSHHLHIHGEDKAKAGAVALAKAMIRDGRMPTPEQATEVRKERLSRDRERRAKQPGEIRRREARAERDRLRHAYFETYRQRQQADSEPFYELITDALDLTDPDLWKSNSFSRLRDRLIIEVLESIARLESDYSWHEKNRDRKLQRAREVLNLLRRERV